MQASALLKKWWIVVLPLFFCASLAAGLFYAKNLYQKDIAPPSDSVGIVNNPMSPEQQESYKQAELYVENQVKNQNSGYPLLENPFNGAYQLEGELSQIIEDSIEIAEGYVVHLYGTFEYSDVNGAKQTVKLPLIIENKNLGMTQLYLGVSDEPFNKDKLSWVIEEGLLGDKIGPHTIQLLLANRSQLKQEFFGTQVVSSLIDYMHPNGFSEFRVNGDTSHLKNNQGWMVAMEITFNPE